jgi:hypothetical protein
LHAQYSHSGDHLKAPSYLSNIAAKGLMSLMPCGSSTSWGRCSRLGQQLLDDLAWIDAYGQSHVDELGNVKPACGPFDFGDKRLLTTGGEKVTSTKFGQDISNRVKIGLDRKTWCW